MKAKIPVVFSPKHPARCRLLSASLLALGLACLPLAARADTAIFTASGTIFLDPDAGTADTNIYLPQFSPANGQLTGVTLTLSHNFDSSYTFQNDTGGAAGQIDYTPHAQVIGSRSGPSRPTTLQADVILPLQSTPFVAGDATVHRLRFRRPRRRRRERRPRPVRRLFGHLVRQRRCRADRSQFRGQPIRNPGRGDDHDRDLCQLHLQRDLYLHARARRTGAPLRRRRCRRRERRHQLGRMLSPISRTLSPRRDRERNSGSRKASTVPALPARAARSLSTLPPGVSLYGGFDGTETALGQRDRRPHGSTHPFRSRSRRRRGNSRRSPG